MTPAYSDVILERLMSLHPKIIDLTLDRMTRLLDALGNPERNLPPVIHIAGTNGKGSTAAMIRAGIEGTGATAHVYTSPHLARFHERIRVAGSLISEPDLTEVLDICEQANGAAQITYFEITTCAALLAFSRTPADYTILEVGLGGRLDATNVVPDPALTVITPVSIDHQQYLGNSLTEIAGEKAGILKRDILGVIAPQEVLAMEAIERQAARVGARLRKCGQHWLVWEERGRLIYQDDYGRIGPVRSIEPPAGETAASGDGYVEHQGHRRIPAPIGRTGQEPARRVDPRRKGHLAGRRNRGRRPRRRNEGRGRNRRRHSRQDHRRTGSRRADIDLRITLSCRQRAARQRLNKLRRRAKKKAARRPPRSNL